MISKECYAASLMGHERAHSYWFFERVQLLCLTLFAVWTIPTLSIEWFSYVLTYWHSTTILVFLWFTRNSCRVGGLVLTTWSQGWVGASSEAIPLWKIWVHRWGAYKMGDADRIKHFCDSHIWVLIRAWPPQENDLVSNPAKWEVGKKSNSLTYNFSFHI